jgi:large subunit ribosomal protein L35
LKEFAVAASSLQQRNEATEFRFGRQKRLQAIKHSGYPLSPAAANEEGAAMPKMKTKSSAKKRFRVRPGGTVKRGQAFKRHILTKKTTKNKRHLRGTAAVHETNMGHIAAMLPFAGL